MDITLSWLAGFFDGEGCVSLVQQKRKTNIISFIPFAVLANTDLPVLKAIQATYGGSLYLKKSHSDLSKKPCWTLSWNRRRALEFLERLLPFLIVKRAKAELVIAGFRNTVPFKHYTKEQKETQARLYQQLQEIKQVNSSPMKMEVN